MRRLFFTSAILVTASFVVTQNGFSKNLTTQTRENNDCRPHIVSDITERKILLPSSLPFKILLDDVQHGSNNVPLAESSLNEKTEVFFPEGTHNLSLPTRTMKSMTIVADASAPQSSHTLTPVPSFLSKGRTIFGVGLKMTLSAEDKVTGVDKTYLSVNNDPFKPVTLGEFAYDKDGDFDIRYFSCDRVGNQEETRKVLFSIDVTPPSSSYFINGKHSDLVLGDNATIILRSEDTKSGLSAIYHKLDDAKEFVPFDNPIAAAGLADGKHTLTYYAEDQVKNRESEKQIHFSIDHTSPEVALSVEGTSFEEKDITFINGTTRFTYSTKDDGAGVTNVRCVDTARKNIPCDKGVVSLQDLSEHITLTVLAEDAVGHTGEAFKHLYIDRRAPEVKAQVRGSQFLRGKRTVAQAGSQVAIEASDLGSGIAHIEVCNDRGESCNTYAQPIALATPGLNTFYFRATDKVGNQTALNKIEVELEAPKDQNSQSPSSLQVAHQWVTDLEKAFGTIGTKTQPFVLQIADSDRKDAQTFTIDLPPEFLEEMRKQSKAEFAFSIAMPKYKMDIEIPIDDDAPRTRAEFLRAPTASREGSTFYGKNLEIKLCTEDQGQGVKSGLAQVNYEINGRGLKPYSSTNPISDFVNEGETVLRFMSSDRVGNLEAPQEIKFMVDLQAPKTQITFEGPHHESVIARTTTLSLTANDFLSGVRDIKFKIDDDQDFSVYEASSFQKNLSSLTPGAHNLRYFATDYVENAEPVQSISFVIDEDGPALNSELIGNHAKDGDTIVYSSGGQLVLTASDRYSGTQEITYQMTPKNEATRYRGPILLPRDQDEITIVVTPRDHVENKSTETVMKFRRDDRDPVTSLKINGKQFVFAGKTFVSGDSTLELSASDEGSLQPKIYYQLNDHPEKLYTAPIPVSGLEDFTLKYFAIDAVGNSEDPHEVRFKVDRIKPRLVVSVGQPIDQQRLLRIGTTDQESGVRSITYRINDGDPRLYRGPVPLDMSKIAKLQVEASDWVSNEDSYEKTFESAVEAH